MLALYALFEVLPLKREQISTNVENFDQRKSSEGKCRKDLDAAQARTGFEVCSVWERAQTDCLNSVT